MFDDILKAANLYDEGAIAVKRRRDEWLEKYVSLREHLKEVAIYLNENARYKQGFFVDTLHAFNEDIKGTSARMPSIAFRSGEMPMHVTFRNTMGEKKAYTEEGFTISFTPIITGQILVLLQPHYSELDKEHPEYATLAMINEPAHITDEVIDNIVAKGIEAAFYSSYTGMGLIQSDGTDREAPLPPRNPIGFKRYDTTQKIK